MCSHPKPESWKCHIIFSFMVKKKKGEPFYKTYDKGVLSNVSQIKIKQTRQIYINIIRKATPLSWAQINTVLICILENALAVRIILN